MKITSTIIEHCENIVVSEIEKLNKKAQKLGCSIFTYSKSAPYMKLITTPKGMMAENMIDIEINGTPIQLNGWNFVARIEEAKNEDNLIFGINNQIVPEEYRTCNPYRCEHCNINRYRKNTWIVRHESGEYRQVGSACIEDFLQQKNPERAILWWMSSTENLMKHIQDLENHQTYNKQVEIDYCMVTGLQVLKQACAVVRIRGKFEFHNEFQHSSSWYVNESIFGCDQYEILEEDSLKAEKIVEFVEQKKDESDYFRNLSIIFKADAVRANNIKFITSSVYAFWKANQVVRTFKNEHIGQVGDKVKLNLKVIKNISVYNQFADSYNQMLLLKDDVGRSFKWVKTSSGNVEEGSNIMLNGSIKKHDVYNSINQTVLTRCKILN